MPKKLGIEATAKNINDLKLQKANEEKVAKEILEAAKAFAEDIKEKSVTVTIKTGEGGKTFGSVSSKEIAAAYKSQLNIEIDKKNCSWLNLFVHWVCTKSLTKSIRR